MTQWIGGPGVSLPISGALFPAVLGNAPPSFNTYTFALASGGTIPIPAGEWIVNGSAAISRVEWYDAVATQWSPIQALVSGGGLAGWRVESDGFNFRVANLTGVATGASVTAAGSGYAQATTTVTPSAGNSTWQAIVGGKVGTITIDAGGANYSKPPLVFFDGSPSPGISATGIAVLTSGAVSSITLVQAGAGYVTAPRIVIVPDPFDPNLSTITPAAAHCVLTGAGTVTGIVLLNFGASQASSPTLTVGGAGSSATAATVPVSGSWVAQATDTIVMQRL